MSKEIYANLTVENKSVWEELGWDLRACKDVNIGTYDFTDRFVDDYFGTIIHREKELMLIISEDFKVNLYNHTVFEIEDVICIKELFDLKLLYVKEVKSDE